jgi:orotidine-5'-phosphate decarboxylase
MLIPGVGTQGGKADEVIETLDDVGYDPRLARINSSSGIMYRAQKDGRPRDEHAEASVEELQGLNQETDIERILDGDR